MSWNSFARETLAVVVALALVSSVAVAPATAASGDDGLLSDDDGDDGGLLTNTTDSLTDTVDSTTGTVTGTLDSATGGATEPVTDTVDSTTGTVTDTVDSTTEPVTDSVSSVTETVGAGDVSTPGSADEIVGVTDGLPTDGLPTDGLPTDGLPTDGLPTDGLPGGAAPIPTDLQSLESAGASTEDLPVEESAVLEPVAQALPTGDAAPIQPEDSPYGSNGTGMMDACQLPVGQEDLPLEAVPEPGSLPVQPSVPGVPTKLLTPETVAGIALSVPPQPCNVYDPHDPSFDPTEPPTDPRASFQNRIVRVSSDTVQLASQSNGRLQQDGFSYDAIWGIKATQETLGATERFSVSDGRTDDYLGLDSDLNVNRTARTGAGGATVSLFGKNVGGSLSCDADAAMNTTLEEPAKGCDYSVEGVINPPLGPGDLVDLLRNPPSESPIGGGGGGGLPPVGSLPGDSDQIINL